ncbi:hypothetical protein [Flavobacterium sp. 316]|uniref:hypothetical protein n=1 Tax=Flavobacterium sp. 316 TaxID=1603293 RepID=UPI0005F9D356|nr:hypothetical protein [Flavobacterium sp. 316]
MIAFTELEGIEEQIAIYDDQKKEWKCKIKRDFSVKDWTDYQYALLKILTDEYSKGKCVFYGYSDYTSKVSESEKLMVPENGTLMIDLTGSYPVYKFTFYNSDLLKNSNDDSIQWSIYWKAIKTFNWIAPQGDPLIDRSEKYSSTVKNVQAVALSFAGQGLVTLNLGIKGLAALKTPVGKAVFETVAQIAVKGDVENVDITDITATVLINNQYARDVLKSFLDTSVEKGLNIKDLNVGLREFGLRIIINKINPVNEDQKGQRYVIDVVKKIELNETKEILKDE